MEKYNAGNMIVCPNVTCRFCEGSTTSYCQRIWLDKLLPAEVERKLLDVVKTDKEGTTAVRQTSQWKWMRLYALQYAGSIQSFLKECGGIE